MLDLISQVITDARVIVIFIIIAIYLKFVGFVAAYKKSNAVKKAFVRRPVVVEETPPAAEAPSEEAAADGE